MEDLESWVFGELAVLGRWIEWLQALRVCAFSVRWFFCLDTRSDDFSEIGKIIFGYQLSSALDLGL